MCFNLTCTVYLSIHLSSSGLYKGRFFYRKSRRLVETWMPYGILYNNLGAICRFSPSSIHTSHASQVRPPTKFGHFLSTLHKASAKPSRLLIVRDTRCDKSHTSCILVLCLVFVHFIILIHDCLFSRVGKNCHNNSLRNHDDTHATWLFALRF